jgi:hypothetical protein
MRRVKVGQQVIGKRRDPVGPPRVELRYDGYRIQREDNLVSVQVLPEWVARELAHNNIDMTEPWRIRAVPAYVEDVEPIFDEGGTLTIDWGFPRQRHILLWGKSRFTGKFER